jgi:hypothetical protein
MPIAATGRSAIEVEQSRPLHALSQAGGGAVVDVNTCSADPADIAVKIAQQLAANVTEPSLLRCDGSQSRRPAMGLRRSLVDRPRYRCSVRFGSLERSVR